MRIAPLLLAALVIAAAVPAARAAEKRILYVYTWNDYFSMREVEAFAKKHNCGVEFDYYDSNDTMLTTLQAGGGYDVITPPPSMARTLFDAGKLKTLDHSLLPDLGNIDRSSASLTDDPEMRYSVPYTATLVGIGYNRSMVPKNAVDSWDVFADTRLAKRMTMFNDMRETIGAALKHLGHSLNTTNPRHIEEAGRQVIAWKKNLDRFDVDQAVEGLRNGEYAAIQAYSGDVAPLMDANPDIRFAVPKEGAPINADVFVIPADSEEPALAHAFINHFLDANAAKNTMLAIRFYLPNVAARRLMDDKTLEDLGFNLSPGIREKCELVHNLGHANALYEKVWEEILLGE